MPWTCSEVWGFIWCVVSAGTLKAFYMHMVSVQIYTYHLSSYLYIFLWIKKKMTKLKKIFADEAYPLSVPCFTQHNQFFSFNETIKMNKIRVKTYKQKFTWNVKMKNMTYKRCQTDEPVNNRVRGTHCTALTVCVHHVSSLNYCKY